MAVFVYSNLSHQMKSVICICKLSGARNGSFLQETDSGCDIELHRIWYKEELKST